VATNKKLPRTFYGRSNVLTIARELLGKVLCTQINSELTCVVITETEAYAGETDKASHAYGGRRTRRTEPMYGEPGAAYVYLCYGIHHLFNVVTNQNGTPHAVLVRGGYPLTGVSEMLRRRERPEVDKTLLGGPGSIGKALGITTELTGCDLLGESIWFEDHGVRVPQSEVEAGPRVGIDYAEEDAALPYRFRVRDQIIKGQI
jgi:DNA-3-methyladenine glycosylase